MMERVEHAEPGRTRTGVASAPTTGDTTANGPSTPPERWLAGHMLAAMGDPPITLVLWDGHEVDSGGGVPRGRVRVLDRSALWGLLRNPELEFGEAYSRGTIVVDGDLPAFLECVYRTWYRPAESAGDRLLRRLYRPSHPPRNTLARARHNIHHHYDLGNDFYRLWLDEQMIYTCAYFPTREMGLAQAQVAKLDHVCRKLRLRPGDRVVEAGCGWGALALHMARHYGARVRAFNISTEQLAHARERARAEGLEDRVEFIEDDYRNIGGECDAFVSVGMLEHVGTENYAEFGRVIDRTLTAEGRGLIHTIGRDRPGLMNSWIERRIFPGAHPPSLKEMLDLFEPRGLSVLDVENLRLHYALTLRHWLERFEGVADQVEKRFDANFVRAWRLYLAGSMAAFNAGNLQLFQVTFARTGGNDIPWTRSHLYE